MKKIIITSKMLLIIAALTFGLISCNKNKITDETEAIAAQNLNIAEVEDDNTQIMADQAEANDAINLRISQNNDATNIDLITPCAVVTKDSTDIGKTITIDFGTGCTNSNGVIRKGKIIVTYTGRYRESGTVIHIISENYYVNENKVDINRTVTNQGENLAGNLVFGIQSTRTVTFPDGTTSNSTTSNKIREWLGGSSTPKVFSDDIYKVTGTGTHISRKGIVYDASTLTPLIRKVACRQFVSGELKIIRHGQIDRFGIINFGAGDCDDVAIVTLDNGKTFSINLKH